MSDYCKTAVFSANIYRIFYSVGSILHILSHWILIMVSEENRTGIIMPFGTNEEIACSRSIAISYSNLHKKSSGFCRQRSVLFYTFEDIYSITA